MKLDDEQIFVLSFLDKGKGPIAGYYRYIRVLYTMGLIELDISRYHFALTDKGRIWLRIYQALK